MYSAVNNLSIFNPALWNPAKAVTVNSSGQVGPGTGSLYNGLQRVANGITPWLAYLVPNANHPAVQAVATGAARRMCPKHR